MTMSEPRIIRMLDAGTGHLPEQICQELNSYDGVTATEREYGWLLWVPEDPTEHAEEYGDGAVPAEVVALQEFARNLDCDYVLLDADAATIEGLPHWDW
jgi:hypothetical protein